MSYVCFMSKWDAPRIGTKFYLCHTEETTGHGYRSQLLPLLFLPDNVATQDDPARISGELWQERYRYYMPFDPPAGTQFFVVDGATIEYIAQLKQHVAASRRPQTATRSLGTIERTSEDGWTFYGHGGGAVAGVDVGDGQVAFDVETWGVPAGGGGGAAGSYGLGGAGMPEGQLVDVIVPREGEWGSMPRSQSARQARRRRAEPRQMAERNVSMRFGDELPVHVRMVDGTQETCTIDHYNRMVEEGRWLGFDRI